VPPASMPPNTFLSIRNSTIREGVKKKARA
jgi:hypothetical protein